MTAAFRALLALAVIAIGYGIMELPTSREPDIAVIHDDRPFSGSGSPVGVMSGSPITGTGSSGSPLRVIDATCDDGRPPVVYIPGRSKEYDSWLCATPKAKP